MKFSQWLESSDSLMVSFNNLIMTKSELLAAIENIIRGYPAMTEGPVEVAYFSKGHKYQLVNGYHRAVARMLSGAPTILSKIVYTNPERWSFPKRSDNFKYDPTLPYKGLENVAEVNQLKRL